MAEREYRVLRLDELPPGTMREVRAGEVAVLLVHHEDGVSALQARCAHYGAPLADGLLHDGRIVCPWHHACFAAHTGALLEPPAIDPLERYGVRVTDGEVLVTPVPQGEVRSRAAPRPDLDPRTFVIVGAGAAGSICAETLRGEGFAGRILMLSGEDDPPYDRTLLSKELLMGAGPPWPFEMRPPGHLEGLGIEFRRGVRVREVDAAERLIALEGGETIAYDRCLIATGGQPQMLDVPGRDLPGVMTLRSRADGEKLIEAAEQGRRVVVIGASFIAMECSASLATRGQPATVIAPDDLPFAKLFGERVGRALAHVHEEMGTRLLLGRHVDRFEGEARLEAVRTDRDERVPADLAVVGIGVRPATAPVCGIELDDDGGIAVDPFLQAADGLFAAGDVARFPEPVSGQRVRIEHWRLAAQHGRLAARNMLGRSEAYGGVPYFWSAQKLALYYVGHAPGFDDVIFDGAPEDGAFIAWYVKDGRVVAALGSQRNRELCAVEELMRLRRLPTPDQVRSGFDPVRSLSAG